MTLSQATAVQNAGADAPLDAYLLMYATWCASRDDSGPMFANDALSVEHNVQVSRIRFECWDKCPLSDGYHHVIDTGDVVKTAKPEAESIPTADDDAIARGVVSAASKVVSSAFALVCTFL